MNATTVSIENIANELMQHYSINSPPVPVEAILQNPARGMWDEVDFSALSSAFLHAKEPFAPRTALARMLVRMLCDSAWGEERGLDSLGREADSVAAMARVLLMPRALLAALPASALNPRMVRMMFEVPLEEAHRRLIEVDVLMP